MFRRLAWFLIGSMLIGPMSVFAQNQVKQGIVPDPLMSEQWYLETTRATAAWELTRGDPRVIIAVLDSGIDIDNPDLKSNIWTNTREVPGNGFDDDGNGYVDDVSGWDFVRSVPDPRPKFDGEWSVPGMQHGTLIAGIAAARGGNGEGISGVAPLTTILPLRVLDGAGEGRVENVVKAIDYAIAVGASIINLSFVGEGESVNLARAMSRAWAAGLVVVAAAGNEQQTGPMDLDKNPLAPVCSEVGEVMIIGVTATDEGDHRASFANTGKKCIDLAAPGTNIFSTELKLPDDARFNRSYGGWWSGTSLAVGVVAGAAALVKSRDLSLSNREIVARLVGGVDPVASSEGAIGAGRLNVLRAVLGGAQESKQVIPLQFHGLAFGNRAGTRARVSLQTLETTPRTFQFPVGPKSDTRAMNVAVADLEGDGVPEVIVVPAFPSVRPRGEATSVEIGVYSIEGKKLRTFVVWPQGTSYGASLATGDINGDGTAEIIVGSSPGTQPKIRVFRGDGERMLEFSAWDAPVRHGVIVTAADSDGDGFGEIFTLPAEGSALELRTFGSNGRFLASAALGGTARGMVSLAVGDVTGDGVLELVIGSGIGGPSIMRLFTLTGKMIFLNVLEESGRGGASVAVGDLDGNGRSEVIAYPRHLQTKRILRYNEKGKRLKSLSLPFATTPQIAVF